MANLAPSKKSFPSQKSFMVADALRQELGNKITIMGAYALGQLLVNRGTPFPVMLPLAIHSVFDGGEGTFKTRVRILDPNGNSLTGDIDLPNAEKLKDSPMQVMLNFNVFQFPMAGRYKVEILLDDNVYTQEISIRESDKPIV